MSVIKALNQVLTSFSLANSLLSQSLHNIFPSNANCKSVANYIHAVLPLNNLQYLVMKEVLDHVI